MPLWITLIARKRLVRGNGRETRNASAVGRVRDFFLTTTSDPVLAHIPGNRYRRLIGGHPGAHWTVLVEDVPQHMGAAAQAGNSFLLEKRGSGERRGEGNGEERKSEEQLMMGDCCDSGNIKSKFQVLPPAHLDAARNRQSKTCGRNKRISACNETDVRGIPPWRLLFVRGQLSLRSASEFGFWLPEVGYISVHAEYWDLMRSRIAQYHQACSRRCVYFSSSLACLPKTFIKSPPTFHGSGRFQKTRRQWDFWKSHRTPY
ncbi:hypothetical protein B0H63DRAFT_252326 [Podospora didyma]|uniref:Uncharacterized protein n=1 Tax=Podospora didyma TaxID=330526 RepID=A0AAE0KMI5_9PEZI|nr:hypothetical protein B0H63DRAFT_252326 [Podospora didyma]